MVYPTLNIVYNSTDDTLADSEYVVFDLETTGLSTRYDYIIEFGAVLNQYTCTPLFSKYSLRRYELNLSVLVTCQFGASMNATDGSTRS